VAQADTATSSDGSGPEESGLDISRFRKMLDDHRAQTSEARQESMRDDDYYHGHQVTADQQKILNDRKQPTNITNRTRRSVEGIIGVMEQAKTDPRAYMRNPPEDEPPQPQQMQPQGMPGQMMGGAAPPMPGQMPPGAQPQQQKPKADAGDVFTKSLRYTADVIDFDTIRRQVRENFLIQGTGAAIFEVDQSNGNEVMGNAIRWEEFVYDPRSRRPDFLDARYLGIYKWQYADFVASIYPEHEADLTEYSGSGTSGLGFDISWEDRPEDGDLWFDSKQKRLVVVEMYYIEKGQWLRCVFFGGGVLDSPKPSPYQDDSGRPICPIIAQSCYVDRNNRRYGIVRDMRGPQDEINMRHWKAIHEINTRQVQQVDPMKGGPIDAEEARKEAARPDGILPPGWQIVPRNDVIANNVQMLQYATMEIERLAPSPAILGRQSADASGRAQQVRQQAGLTELYPVIAQLESWDRRSFKMMGSIQRQYWTEPKWIRVTEDSRTPEYLHLNNPIIDPMTGQVIKIENEIAKMDVDIIVETVPDTATLKQEVWTDWVQLAGVYGPEVAPIELMLELSPIAEHQKIIDKIESYRAKAAQAAQQNPALQLQIKKLEAQVMEIFSKIDVNRATAKDKDVHATLDAMHGVADARGYESGMPPPGTPKGALNGSGAPHSPQASSG
jgi:hypothetical protein